MHVEELQTPSSEELQVLDWRVESLARVGFSADMALALAEARHVDLHAALDLVRLGCPPETVARILL